MRDAIGTRSRDEGLAFFGRITAGQTHELTNVLNIINELAGLQQDLLSATSRGRPVDLPRLESISGKIQSHVARGETIIRHINRFAHSVDLPVAVFEARELLSGILFLAERSTRLSRMELVADLAEETVALESSPFCLQQAVFTCIEVAISAAADLRRVSVTHAVRSGGVEVVVTSGDPLVRGKELDGKLAFLQMLMEEVGGELGDVPVEGELHRLSFFVPGHRRPRDDEGVARTTEGRDGD